MQWLATLAALANAAVPLVRWENRAEEPSGDFDASFIQIGDERRTFDEERWLRELALLRDLGIRLVIVQFTGDEIGAYDRGKDAPLASLVRAAARLDIRVMLGLHYDPTWPSEGAVMRLPPPL
ncbi:MAG TPA: hypothetical protein VLB44_04375, partial [Kofleriaceae bacterium]|nr:hypothetical protein [Kofleriaceae bacterium]